MRTNRYKPWVWPALALSLLVLVSIACSAATGGTEAPAGTSGAPSGGGAVTTLDGVKSAVIQIEASGGLTEPGQGTVEASWSGSGFFIDPSGIAVTNNHVVTGAALLKARVGGEGDWKSAKVLGVSECSDLAVIQVEGSGYPYLTWYTDPVKVGLNMYVGGFPLGDPEYTLVRGIISKEKADGKTNWTSVESVVEYDAATNPGSSGGPAVTDNGQVIAVNFAGNQARQAFGIARASAQPVIDELRKGNNVDTIGVNGEAFVSQDQTLAGIWVSSVASGSIADKAGLQGGDIIVTMEGVQLGKDGTKGDYCDILRSHKPTDTLTIKVIRFATGEVLGGQLNGRQLSTSFTFGTGDTTPQPGGSTGPTASASGEYSGYTKVTDSSNSIQIEVPNEWTDAKSLAWNFEGTDIGVSIAASANLNDFSNYKDSGVLFRASEELAKAGGYVQVLDYEKASYTNVCKYDTRLDYDDGTYRGKADRWTRCNGNNNTLYVISAIPKADPTKVIIEVHVLMTKDADQAALDHIINSFEVIGSLP